MRILLYGINFAPELTGVGKYTGEMAAWLAGAGHEVRVVTAPPHYPAWKVGEGYVSGRYMHEAWRGVRVWRCPLWLPDRMGGMTRLLLLLSFALSSLPVMVRQLFWRPDAIWVVEPALCCAPSAWLVARLSGAKAWLHIQDYEVDAAFGLGWLKSRLLGRAIFAVERWLMRRFDRVSTISIKMSERAIAKGVPAHRVVLFPNWVDLTAITPGNRLSRYREELGIGQDTVVALYSGNMGTKQGLEILANAAAMLKDDADVRFLFCGEGPGRDDLVARCKGLPNVHFLHLQPLERLSELLATADIHLLPQRNDAADLVMPSKLIGMLASGRAIVATAESNTELGRAVAQGGLVVPPEDASAFAGAIRHLADDVLWRGKLGEQGRAYAEARFDREAMLSTFEAELIQLCSGPVLQVMKPGSSAPDSTPP